jgi:hypothetical protein
MPDQLAVTVTDTMGVWSITSSGSVDVNGTIAVTPPATGAWIKFGTAVTHGSNPASIGPYTLSTMTLYSPTASGSNSITAGPTQNGPWCTAHPISVGRGGTGGS